MVSLSSWARYIALKYEYSASRIWKRFERGQVNSEEAIHAILKNVFVGKLTYLYWNRGEEMAPTIGAPGGTLLVRKLLAADPKYVFTGDVVLLRDPMKSHNYIVRRLAAIEGCGMGSKDEKEEPFVLEKNQCWVLSDNENLKPKEAMDSRTFGPVPMTNIVGRVIYSMRTAVDHGPVQNSSSSVSEDFLVLEIELDVEEMKRTHHYQP